MQERIKLLYVVEAMGGGVFTYLVDLANELVNSYDIYIAYAIRPQTPKDYKDYFDDRIHLIEVENFTRSVNLMKDIKAFFEIKNIANKVNPDIIHLHSSKAGVLGRWAFNGKRIPICYTPHGYSFLMSNNSGLKRRIYRFIETISAKRYCTTISCSEGEHKESMKLTDNAFYVDNAINIEELKKTLNEFEVEKKSEFTVFTIGRICHQKNPKLFNQIAEALPEIRFLWIGDGELRSQLNAPNIEVTGWVERKDALKYSVSGDVFILTSLWEGLPIALLEAMYMKKVCIVSDVIGNRDVIQSSTNGQICNCIDEFCEAIKKSKKGDFVELANTAHQNVVDRYNTVVMAQKYNSIYNEKLMRKVK